MNHSPYKRGKNTVHFTSQTIPGGLVLGPELFLQQSKKLVASIQLEVALVLAVVRICKKFTLKPKSSLEDFLCFSIENSLDVSF